MAVGYIRWDQQGVEHGAGPKEDAVIHEIEKQINEAQQRVIDSHHHAFSGTHVKVSNSAQRRLQGADCGTPDTRNRQGQYGGVWKRDGPAWK